MSARRRRPLVFRDKLAKGGEAPAYVIAPAGAFLMGSPADDPAALPAERPQRAVRFDAPFGIGRHAVRIQDYARFARAAGRKLPAICKGMDRRRPMIDVPWVDAVAYCGWLTAQTGARYRLPCESEWEYACRAGTATPFWTGETISTVEANFDPSCGRDQIGWRGETLRVGQLPANPWGLHEVHGNVGEWCADRWTENHDHAEPLDRPRPIDLEDPMQTAVVRGGGWSTKATFLRSADRYHYSPTVGYEMVGFRILRELY